MTIEEFRDYAELLVTKGYTHYMHPADREIAEEPCYKCGSHSTQGRGYKNSNVYLVFVLCHECDTAHEF